MARLTVALALESPLLTGRTRQGDVYQSQNYLPGSVLRGAVAEALMADWTPDERRRPHPDECPDRATCSLCTVLYPLDGPPPRFGDCYPTVLGSDEARPFPLSARTCKRHGGFIRAGVPEPKHGVFDTLIAAAAAEDAAASGLPLPYLYRTDCPACGEETTAAEGSFSRSGDAWYTAVPVNRRFSRTAINRVRFTAQESQLFTLTVMGEQMRIEPDLPGPDGRPAAGPVRTRLVGTVETGAADADALIRALEAVRGLGSGRSRGLGRVAGVSAARPFGGDATLDTRIDAFNARVAEERTFYAAFDVPVLTGRRYFTLDLLSAAYLRRDGLPVLRPGADMLGLDGATLVYSLTAPVEHGGWVSAWGLPRERRVGAAPGSVYLFRVDGDPTGDARLTARLAELEQTGIGEDTERGAGRVLVCAPFHQEVTPQ